MQIDYIYNAMIGDILDRGFFYRDESRDNITMLQIPHYSLEIPWSAGFPLLTTKQIFWKTVLHELVWMLSGSEDISYLQKNGVKIWDIDAKNFSGSNFVGRIYGAQWRNWTDKTGGVDQIAQLMANIKKDRFSRRHLVTAWNPAELDGMALPPCHWSFEFIPDGQSAFILKWHQRSCDAFLGIPFDIVLYAYIGLLIQHETGLHFRTLIGDLSNVHLYGPHIELAKEQIARRVLVNRVSVQIAPEATLTNLKASDIEIHNYEYHPAIKAQMYGKIKK